MQETIAKCVLELTMFSAQMNSQESKLMKGQFFASRLTQFKRSN